MRDNILEYVYLFYMDEEELKDLSLEFRGSSNQRILNLKEMRDSQR